MMHKWWRLKLWWLKPVRKRRRRIIMQDASLNKTILRDAVERLQREISFQLSEAPVHRRHVAELQAEVERLQGGGEIDPTFLQKIRQW